MLNLNNEQFEILIIVIIIIIIIITILYLIFKSPFNYPYFDYYFDVSGKRKPKIEDYIDKFLIEQKFLIIEEHKKKIEDWKLKSQKIIEQSLMKKYRLKQYKMSLDDEHAFTFHFIRKQTRYRQQDYIRTAYKIDQIIKSFNCSYMYLYYRNEKLKSINYACTLNEYNSNNQRKLVTKVLRKQIMIRDNYTCQICGKYMPDEVGLQIDHKISVSKGGKTIPSNLQVLCSKCNGKKSNK